MPPGAKRTRRGWMKRSPAGSNRAAPHGYGGSPPGLGLSRNETAGFQFRLRGGFRRNYRLAAGRSFAESFPAMGNSRYPAGGTIAEISRTRPVAARFASARHPDFFSDRISQLPGLLSTVGK